ncbi:hypothetical protein BS78_01G363400 [Paspalum vaginatum]|nr:hypothetical protein BS78_01G363400 [Paspalum vaginatum]
MPPPRRIRAGAAVLAPPSRAVAAPPLPRVGSRAPPALATPRGHLRRASAASGPAPASAEPVPCAAPPSASPRAALSGLCCAAQERRSGGGPRRRGRASLHPPSSLIPAAAPLHSPHPPQWCLGENSNAATFSLPSVSYFPSSCCESRRQLGKRSSASRLEAACWAAMRLCTARRGEN